MHEGHKLPHARPTSSGRYSESVISPWDQWSMVNRPSVTIPSAISPNFFAPNFVQGSGSPAPSLIALLIRTLFLRRFSFLFPIEVRIYFFSSFSSGLILNEIGSVRAQNSLAALNCDGLVSNIYFVQHVLKILSDLL